MRTFAASGRIGLGCMGMSSVHYGLGIAVVAYSSVGRGVNATAAQVSIAWVLAQGSPSQERSESAT